MSALTTTYKVKQQTLELNTQLYTENKTPRRALGALAEIDTIQAEAEMKSSQQPM